MFNIKEFRQYMKSKFSWVYRARQKRYRALKTVYSTLMEYPTALSYQANEEVLRIVRKEMKEVRQLIFDVKLQHNDVFHITLDQIDKDLRNKLTHASRTTSKPIYFHKILTDVDKKCRDSRENTTLCVYTKLMN